jgi:uncharacterized membrane protein
MARPATIIKPSTTSILVGIGIGIAIAIIAVRIAIAIVAVAIGIVIIAITIVIARTITIVSITVATHGNASPQNKPYQKKNPKENQFFIYKINPFLSYLYI